MLVLSRPLVGCLPPRLWRDDFVSVMSDMNALLNGPSDKFSDVSDPEIRSLSKHLQAFNSAVMESGNPTMAAFMSAFSPELHAVDVITRVVDSIRVATGARDAIVFVIDRCAAFSCGQSESYRCVVFAHSVP